MLLTLCQIFFIIYTGDKYPRRYGCKSVTCTYLKSRGRCNARWKSAGLPSWCLNTLSAAEKNQRIRTHHCRRTCATCRPGKQKTGLRKMESRNISGKRSYKSIQIVNRLYLDII